MSKRMLNEIKVYFNMNSPVSIHEWEYYKSQTGEIEQLGFQGRKGYEEDVVARRAGVEHSYSRQMGRMTERQWDDARPWRMP